MQKKIKGFNYTIDENGTVRNSKGHILVCDKSRGAGYFSVHLYKDGKGYNKLIHRLVAEAFILNPENKPLVCHKDGNPANNRIKNLYYGTHFENSADRKKHGTNYGARGEKQHCAKLNAHKVKLIKLLRNFFKWPFQKIANLYKVDYKAVWNICNNVSWKHII